MAARYIESYRNSKLREKADKANSMLKACSICPRKCGVNRLNNEKGFCGTGLRPKVYSYLAHHGEEPAISGSCGSGAIFFSGCNMRCSYCQNYQFSQSQEGREVEAGELAAIMLRLKEAGCHNINLVTPTHVMPQILAALLIAVPQGLDIPLVYNTGGYELGQAIDMLCGIVDVYLADMRYACAKMSAKYSSAPDYPFYNRQAARLMRSQVGIADIDKRGIIKSGLIIRHLVLPNNISGTAKILRFISRQISADTYVSLMSQYRPYYQAGGIKELSRRLSRQEYSAAEALLEEYGLYNGWTQDGGGLERFAGSNIKQR